MARCAASEALSSKFASAAQKSLISMGGGQLASDTKWKSTPAFCMDSAFVVSSASTARQPVENRGMAGADFCHAFQNCALSFRPPCSIMARMVAIWFLASCRQASIWAYIS